MYVTQRRRHISVLNAIKRFVLIVYIRPHGLITYLSLVAIMVSVTDVWDGNKMSLDVVYVTHHLQYYFSDIIVGNVDQTFVTTAVNMMRRMGKEYVIIIKI